MMNKVRAGHLVQSESRTLGIEPLIRASSGDLLSNPPFHKKDDLKVRDHFPAENHTAQARRPQGASSDLGVLISGIVVSTAPRIGSIVRPSNCAVSSPVDGMTGSIASNPVRWRGLKATQWVFLLMQSQKDRSPDDLASNVSLHPFRNEPVNCSGNWAHLSATMVHDRRRKCQESLQRLLRQHWAPI